MNLITNARNAALDSLAYAGEVQRRARLKDSRMAFDGIRLLLEGLYGACARARFAIPQVKDLLTAVTDATAKAGSMILVDNWHNVALKHAEQVLLAVTCPGGKGSGVLASAVGQREGSQAKSVTPYARDFDKAYVEAFKQHWPAIRKALAKTPPASSRLQSLIAQEASRARLKERISSRLEAASPPQSPISVDLPSLSVVIIKTMRRVEFRTEAAVRWLKVLSDHAGSWISGPDLGDYDAELIGARTDRLRKSLPTSICKLIETSRRFGARLKLS